MPVSSPTLERRALNRATLTRQLLVERSTRAPLEAVQYLLGLQAQNPPSPYVALWSRLRDFDPHALSAHFDTREVVRVAAMRNTIHLLAADDALCFRAHMQVVADRQFRSTQFARDVAGVDRSAVVARGRELLAQAPRTNADLGRLLAEQCPGVVPGSLAQLVRHDLALVQIPPRGKWGESMAPTSATIEQWLGRELGDSDAAITPIVVRYLAAYGPASIMDFQAWCGLTRMRPAFESLRPELVTFRNEQGVELFDLPDAPRPAATTHVPPRFLPDYENALLSFADRSRFSALDPRPPFGLGTAHLVGTFLVDGFLAGRWRVDRNGDSAVLEVETLAALKGALRSELRAEAEAFIAFLAPDAAQRDVRVSRIS